MNRLFDDQMNLTDRGFQTMNDLLKQNTNINMKNKQVSEHQLTPEVLSQKLLKENKEGGTIFLSDFMAQLPGNTEKSHVIQVLKNNKEGIFIPGRHGRPSRWLYGPMRSEISQEETEVATTSDEQPTRRRGPRGKDMVTVKVTIGNQEGFLSFNKLDLVSDVLAAS